MRDIREAFKKSDPITGRPTNIGKEVFDKIQHQQGLSIGETLDFIIKEAAESMAAKGIISLEADDTLNFWNALNKVGQQYNKTENKEA